MIECECEITTCLCADGPHAIRQVCNLCKIAPQLLAFIKDHYAKGRINKKIAEFLISKAEPNHDI